MIGLSLGLVGRRGGVEPTDTLGVNDWTTREAVVGDTGTTDGVERGPVTLANDTGRLWVRIFAPALAGGEWGIEFGSTGLVDRTIGDVISPSSQTVGAGAGSRNILRNPRTQDPTVVRALYRATPGSGNWTVASETKTFAPTAQAVALTVDDWTPAAFVASAGVLGVKVGQTSAFSSAANLFWSLDGSTWGGATSQTEDDVTEWTLTGLTDDPGATITGLRLRVRDAASKTSETSDTKSVVLPALPSAPGGGDASLASADVAGADRLTFSVATLPDSDLPLTSLEYQLSDDDTTFGAWVSIPAAVGDTQIAVTASTLTYLRWRGVSALGAGSVSASLSATPASGAAESDPISLLASHTTAIEGQMVHFEPANLGTAFGTTDREVKDHGDFRYVYSGETEEDYTFPHMNADMRTANTAGSNRGHYGAHAYVKGGTVGTPIVHTCTLTCVYGGVTKTATATVSVVSGDASYPTTATGCWSEAGTYTAAPSGAKVDFADFQAAIDWLAAADDRRLLLRRGEEYFVPSIITLDRTNQQIGAFDTGADPILKPTPNEPWREPYGRGGYEAEWISDGIETSLSLAGQSDGGVLRALGDYTRYDVYADNARLVAGTDYTALTAGDATLELLATQDADVVIRLFRAPLRGILSTLLRSRGTGAVIRDLNFVGSYDPVTPSVFDPDDLSTFDHDISTIAINPNNNLNRMTVLNCQGSGLRSLIEADGVSSPGDMLLLSGISGTNWYNYGAFTAQHARVCLIGCDLSQPIDALLEATGKTENVEDQRNSADHGPVRMPFNDRSIIARNRVDSRTSWSGDDDESPAQPCWRLMQSFLGGQSYAFSENYCIGGSAPGPNGGPPNAELPMLRCEEAVATHNVFVWTSVTGGSGGGRHSYVWRSNLHYLAVAVPSTTGPLTLLQTKDWNGFAAADIATDAPQVYGDTFIVLDGASRPAFDLILGNAAEQQAAGPTNIQATATTTAGQTEVTFSFGRPTYGYGARWRIYSSTDGGSTWAEVGGGDSDVPVLEELGGDPEQRRFTLAGYWVALTTGANNSGTTVVTFDTARSAGEQLVLTWNPTIDAAGVTFFPNNLSSAIVRAAPVVSNCAIFVDATFNSVLDVADGSTITPDGGDVDSFYRPQAGNPLLTKATTGRRAALDLMGDAKTLTIAGSLATATDLTGWAALPLPPTVTVAWSPDAYTTADSPSATNIVPSIDVAGTPAVDAGDIVKTFGITRGGAAVSLPLEEGDTLTGLIRAPHILLGRNEIALPDRIVEASTFSRAVIDNGGAAAINVTDSGRSNITEAVHIAARVQLGADPGATLRLLYAASGFRINIPTNRRPNFSANGSAVFGSDAARVLETTAYHSFLFSVWPTIAAVGQGPSGVTGRLIWDNGTAVTTSSDLGADFNMDSLTLLGISIGGDGSPETPYVASQAPDVLFDTWFGIWQGGDPGFGDFFDTSASNVVKAPPADGAVTGMNRAVLFNSLIGFNNATNSGSFAVGTGYPFRTLAAFTTP